MEVDANYQVVVQGRYLAQALLENGPYANALQLSVVLNLDFGLNTDDHFEKSECPGCLGFAVVLEADLVSWRTKRPSALQEVQGLWDYVR